MIRPAHWPAVAVRGHSVCYVIAALVALLAVTTAGQEVLGRRQRDVPAADADGAAAAGMSRRHSIDDGGLLPRRRRAAMMDRAQLFREMKSNAKLDIVFALERSSVPPNSKRNFVIEQKKFVRSMIRDFLYIKPDATRIALVTYGTDVSVAFDGITQMDSAVTKCDVISSDHLWDKVMFFDGVRSSGVNLTGVFKVTTKILATGRRLREQSRSYLILLTSAAHAQYEYVPDQPGHRDWFDTYGVGITDTVDRGKLSHIVANSNTNIYGTISEWRNTMRIAMETAHVIAGTDPEWVPYSSAGCGCLPGSKCWCDISTGFTRCGCQQGYIKDEFTCVQPCIHLSVCPANNFHCRPIFEGISYECQCFLNDGLCNVKRVTDCPPDACRNGGTCFEGKNQYACVCPPGFGGRHCEVNENECSTANMCPPNKVCHDEINSYRCVDRQGPELPANPTTPYFRSVQPLHTTPRVRPTTKPAPQLTTIPFFAANTYPPKPGFTKLPMTNPQSPKPALTTSTPPAVTEGAVVVQSSPGGFLGKLSDNQRLLLMVVPPAVIGLCLVLIGVCTLIHVTRKKGDRKKRKLSGVTDSTSVASQSPSLVTFDSNCYTNEGTPGPPKSKKAAKAAEAESNRVTYGEFDEPVYGNEAMQSGMEEWYPYVLELYSSHKLNRILIIRLDGEKWVLSPGSKLYMKEIEAIFNLLSKKMIKGTFDVQGREFGIVGNNDFVIMAHTFRNSKREQEILCATKTRQFVIIGTANFSTDGGQCKEKVLELRDHIKSQGL